jgi:polysaccharide pyruvyl transferase WcaK-like protein
MVWGRVVIEVRKAGFVNKGAELMLRAIISRLATAHPEALLTMAPTRANGDQPFRKVVDAGFYPKAALYWRQIQWGNIAAIAPWKLREMYGVVLDRQVDIVLDAAGFAYSDQWGVDAMRELAQSARRWRRQGTKLILLPQAFGPFQSALSRRLIRRIVESADLVMPRDRISHEHLTAVVGDRPHVRRYPDFTNLVDGVVPEAFDPKTHRVCIVPNFRMIDRVSPRVGAAYVPFMQACARYLLEKRARPFILVHEGAQDRILAEQISAGAGDVPVMAIEDPLAIKGVLGASHATVGSRFHGLVSALSQGVPSIATRWSHKYEELFSDYGFPEGVVSVDMPEQRLTATIDAIVDDQPNAALRAKLLTKADALKAHSEAMWDEVHASVTAAMGSRVRVASLNT